MQSNALASTCTATNLCTTLPKTTIFKNKGEQTNTLTRRITTLQGQNWPKTKLIMFSFQFIAEYGETDRWSLIVVKFIKTWQIKWFEPRGVSCLSSVIIQVRVVFRKTVVDHTRQTISRDFNSLSKKKLCWNNWYSRKEITSQYLHTACTCTQLPTNWKEKLTFGDLVSLPYLLAAQSVEHRIWLWLLLQDDSPHLLVDFPELFSQHPGQFYGPVKNKAWNRVPKCDVIILQTFPFEPLNLIMWYTQLL